MKRLLGKRLLQSEVIPMVRKAITVVRASIEVKRKSIHVNRTPIHLSTSERMMEKIRKRKEECGTPTYTERKILDIADYYNYKVRKVLGVGGWKCLSKNYKNHKNWKILTKIFNLCKENGWDYRIYLDAQFYRVRNWKRETLYPYLTHCISDTAVYAYHSYVNDYKNRYSPTGDIEVKPQDVPKSQRDDVINTIINDCSHFVDLQKKAPKLRQYKGLDAQQIKFKYIIENVSALSQYYWASLSWSLSYLQRFDTQWVKDLANKVKALQKSASMMKLITKVVTEVESQLGILPTVIPEF